MTNRRLFCFIFTIIIFCSASIYFVKILPLDSSLQSNLISEIIGSGVLGSIVAGIFFYLAEESEYQASKNKAMAFYKNKLLLDINEAGERGPSIWNLSGLNKFYFDGSFINSLFDIYQDNFLSINDYSAYFPKDKLINTYNDFYKVVRRGYVAGEKLENIIRQFVRSEHHKLGLISANDKSMVMFLKGRLFANLPDTELIKHIEWNTVPDRATQFLDQLGKDSPTKTTITDLTNTRTKLVKLEKQILKLAKKTN